MQISAGLIYWDELAKVSGLDDFEERLLEDEFPQIDGPDFDWRSDSVILFFALSEGLSYLVKHFSGQVGEGVSYLTDVLFNEATNFPNELGVEVDPELIAGSFNPETSKKVSSSFDTINYESLQRLFESELPDDQFEKELISSFVTSLKEWHRFFRLAKENRCGVFVHMG